MDSTSLAYTGVGIGALALAYYATKKSPEIDPLYDFEQQSIEIDEIEHVRVFPSVVNKPLIEYYSEDVRTLHHVLSEGMKISGNGPCLGYREDGAGPYIWVTYSDVIQRTRFVGSGLLYKGIKAENTTNIGIYSRNRIEWTICEYACYSYSMNVISLYDTYGEDSIKYVLNQAEIEALFLDSIERLINVLKSIDELPHLKYLIYFNDIDLNEIKHLKIPPTVEIIKISTLMEIGSKNLRSPVPPKPTDTATICYTSGTTGNPKGAMITHGNIICNVAACHRRLHQPHLKLNGADVFKPVPVHYCFLPLAHMMERLAMLAKFYHFKGWFILHGGRAGYISGDIITMLDDCQTLKPNSITLVPRLLNRFYDRVKAEIGNNQLKSMLLKRAIASKESDRLNGIIRQDTFYDKLIFQKIRNLLGGNILRSATGSAPISKEVIEFARACFSCPLPEAYGQTEATCCITFSHILEPIPGHCGPPLECSMVKLVDIPEMGYFAKEGKGEICAKGPNIFKGYYKEPDKTAEVIDKDGWLHTGDVGMWLPGEYISPEKVEHAYLRCPFIAQIFVDGDSLKDYCVAIVVPEQEYLLAYCKKFNINGTFQELCRNQEIRKLILNEMEVAAEKGHLLHLERVKNIYLHDELFSSENGFLTPTLKLKRYELRRNFKQKIQNLYHEILIIKSKL